MPGALPRIRSRAERELPTGLYLSFLVARVLAIATPPTVLVLSLVALVGPRHGSDFGRPLADLQLWEGLAFLLAFEAWLCIYWSALRSQALWFREFVVGSGSALFLPMCVAAVLAGARLFQVLEAVVVLVVLPWWYLYRKESVVAYFDELHRGSRVRVHRDPAHDD